MGKIRYAKEGISPSTNGSNNNFLDELQHAIDICQFDVPNDCAYRDWIYDLSNSLRGCKNTIQGIKDKIERTDSNIATMATEAKSRIALIEPVIIEKNERLIK